MSAPCFDREDCTIEPGIEIENRLLELIRIVDMLDLALEDGGARDGAPTTSGVGRSVRNGCAQAPRPYRQTLVDLY